MRLSFALVIGALLCACTAPGAGPDSRELTVMSWNLLHGADEFGNLNLEAKGAYLARQCSDLVSLQEIDRKCARSGAVDQLSVLADLTGMEPQFGSFMAYDGGHYGMGSLSALPSLGSRALELPPGDEPRVALIREVRVLEHSMLFVNVHFNWIEDDRARFAQAQALLLALESQELPCIIAGDFNDRPGSRTLEAFYASGFVHVEPAGPTWNARAPSKDIDHVLIRSGPDLKVEALGGRILDGDLLSDHCALVVRVRVSDRE